MADIKIALVGAGSYVFGPSFLAQVYLEHRLSHVELALIDVSKEGVELMAGVGRRMAESVGVPARITTHTDWRAGLAGADFVVCSAAREGLRRFEMDAAIVARLAPDHKMSEFGGIAGISYSLRQIALIEQLAADMRAVCPDAWLLSVANPLPRVCQAAQEAGVKTAGFCAVAIMAYARPWKLLTGQGSVYPFAEPRAAYAITNGGLNHFSWILALRDRATDEDLLPVVRQRLAEGGTTGQPVTDALARQTGYLPAAGDSHIRDFLEPDLTTGLHEPPFHGDPEQRRRRMEQLSAVADGALEPTALLEHVAWEKPIDFVAAFAGGAPVRLEGLNLVNAGQIANLPEGVFVETPCRISTGAAEPETLTLPESILPLCARTVEVTAAIVRAARQRSRQGVHQAVELDPTITDKAAGRAAMDACIAAHADILPEYQ